MLLLDRRTEPSGSLWRLFSSPWQLFLAAQAVFLRHRFAQSRPFQQGIKCWTQGLTPLRQAVLNLGWNLVVDGAADDSVGFHLAKLLDEHLLGNGRDRPFQVGKAQDLAAEEMKQD